MRQHIPTRRFLLAALLSAAAMPALAQTPPATPATATNPPMTEATEDAIIVTGTLLRDRNIASPTTTVTAESLDRRGLSTIQSAIQQLVSNNGPALGNNFSANGAFAGGASAVSLRGLSTNSTLVLFDGLRASYYPLADDGTRNFVDLNTIPDDIVDRIEVLRDGSSANYGADAIAGVVNIITKRQFQGFTGRAEGGLSSRGDAANYRLSATAGIGDLASKGFNAYVSGFYYLSESLKYDKRPYPFNTDDLRGFGGPDNRFNGLNTDGTIDPGTGAQQASPFLVRPYDATNTTPLGRFQQLETGCRGLPTYRPSAGELALPGNTTTPSVLCQEDFTQLYSVISPRIERFGGSARVTAAYGGQGEAYAEFNFLQTRSNYTGAPSAVRSNGATGIFFPRFSTGSTGAAFAPGSFPLTLPVYVCPQGRGDASGLATGCNATNGVLNPNNPFAAAGQVARIQGRLPIQTFDETVNRTYRAAIGTRGDATDWLAYTVEGTAMHTDLARNQSGYIRTQNLLDAIARGTYNFVDPLSNSQAANEAIAPPFTVPASSDLYQIRGVFRAKGLPELRGGPLAFAAGAEFRYEAVSAPSGNSDQNGPTQRYLTRNAFGAVGNRTVTAGFFEFNAPILKQISLNVAGRYDSYSSGQSAFSPKFSAVVRPIRQVTLRGTYAEGFRIPSFGEANSLPTTGFVNAGPSNYTDAFLRQYGANCSLATFQQCPTYIRTAAYGLTTLGTPDLQPESSRSFSLGGEVTPIRNVRLYADYYNIRKTNAISAADSSPAIAAYYAGAPIPAGFAAIPDVPDPQFPNAQPRLGFVESGYVNASRIDTDGIEFGVEADVNLTRDIAMRFAGSAAYIFNLSTTFDGNVQRYAGTLGNYNLTAGSGTQRWRAQATDTLTWGKVGLTGTMNFYDGYNQSAADQGNVPGDCGLNPGYGRCNVQSYVTFDANIEFRVTDKWKFYVTALNLADRLPPIDTATYGAHLYNSVVGGDGILGRYFRAGIVLGF